MCGVDLLVNKLIKCYLKQQYNRTKMFKVPNWDSDIPNNSVRFEKKTQNKKNNKTEPALNVKASPSKAKQPEVSPRKAALNVKASPSKAKQPEVSPRKAALNVKATPSKAKQPEVSPRKNLIKHEGQKTINNNNDSKVKKKKLAKKRKVNIELSEKDIVNMELDEAIVKAKKKRFNDAQKIEDEENVLFSETTTEKNKKIKEMLSNKSKIPIKKNKFKNNLTKNYTEDDTSGVLLKEKRQRVGKNKVVFKEMLEARHRRTINVSSNSDKLRMRMLDRLKAAQFRYLNEKLYTSSGNEAKEIFQKDPSAFKMYHQGYQQQVKKWPVNPLDVIVKKILRMPQSAIIADMGCGEASLSKRLPHTVKSFDLVATAPDVVVCDMAHTPLQASSVDVAVYCLALMGAELTQYLVEANRILKVGGQLLIAEVESRFDDVNEFTRDVEKLGFKLKSIDKQHSVFFFLHFVKNREPPSKKGKLPAVQLKPCFYKKR